MGCEGGINRTDLIFKSGYYFARNNNSPFSGEVTAYSETEGWKVLEVELVEGIPIHSRSYLEDEEVLYDDYFKTLDYNGHIQFIKRISLLKSYEGEFGVGSPFLSCSVNIIVDNDSIYEYDSVISEVLNELESKGFFDETIQKEFNLRKEGLSVFIRLGELESPLFETKIN